jgi:hypothetical protein
MGAIVSNDVDGWAGAAATGRRVEPTSEMLAGDPAPERKGVPRAMAQAKHLEPVVPVIEIAPSGAIDDNRALINGEGTERNRRREPMMAAGSSKRTTLRFSFSLSLSLLASLQTATPAWVSARLGHRRTA